MSKQHAKKKQKKPFVDIFSPYFSEELETNRTLFLETHNPTQKEFYDYQQITSPPPKKSPFITSY